MSRIFKKTLSDVNNLKAGEYRRRKAKLLEQMDEESVKVREEIDNLSLFSLKLRYTTLIIALAVIALIAVFIQSPVNFFIYWLVSSFVFLMFNPFIFLIPTGRERGIESARNKEFSARGIVSDLKDSMMVVKKEKKFFAEFGWKLFFINCQPLAPGFIGIFLISMIFGAMLYFFSIFDRFTFGILLVQCIAIIAFYTGIWFVKPYSDEFISYMLGIKVRAKKSYHTGFRTFFKYIMIVAVLATIAGVVMLLALLLPGFTLGRILEDGSEEEFKIIFFIVVFISQVILVRYIQGGSSRRIVENFLRVKMLFLEKLRSRISSVEPAGLGDDDEMDPEYSELLISAERSALEMNLLRTDYHNFGGYFPVCLISPNTKMLLKLYQYYPGETGEQPL
jgi:ABC-type multidrug transport system fused ATPase/permease subunit